VGAEPTSEGSTRLKPKEEKTTGQPLRPRAPPNKKGPPVLAGVSAQDRALAASPGDSPAQRAARKNVTRTFLEENGRKLDRKSGYHVQLNDGEVESELVGHDFSKPVIVGPPPPCPASQWQWQTPNGAQGQYYAERSAVPDGLGIARDGTDYRTGVVIEKVQTQFRMDSDAPYLKSTAAPAIDNWSVPGREVPTSGGDIQYVVGDRSLATAESGR
jgi:hypothetical protein